MYYKLFRLFLLGSFAGFYKKKKKFCSSTALYFYKEIKNEQDDVVCIFLLAACRKSHNINLKTSRCGFFKGEIVGTHSCTRLNPLKNSRNV